MLYQCLRSGRTLELSDPDDIERMKDNESYRAIEVSAYFQGDVGEKAIEEEIPRQNAVPEKVLKSRGRPRKQVSAAPA